MTYYNLFYVLEIVTGLDFWAWPSPLPGTQCMVWAWCWRAQACQFANAHAVSVLKCMLMKPDPTCYDSKLLSQHSERTRCTLLGISDQFKWETAPKRMRGGMARSNSIWPVSISTYFVQNVLCSWSNNYGVIVQKAEQQSLWYIFTVSVHCLLTWDINVRVG